MSAGGAVADTDEWLHEPSGDPEWAEEVALLGWDERADVVVFSAIRLEPVVRRARAQTAVWVQDRARCHGGEEDGVPPHNWDVMEVGGVGVRMERAGERWTLSTSVPQAFLTFDGLSPCHWDGAESYLQHGSLRGEVVVDGTRLAFDGIAVRVHAWGVDEPGSPMWVEAEHAGRGAPLAPAGERLAQVEACGDRLDAWRLAPAGVAIARQSA